MKQKRRVLELLAEHKLSAFVASPAGSAVLEASGIVALDTHFYVVFDNIRRVARLDRQLLPDPEMHAWLGRRRQGDGYEDIAYDANRRRFYLLIEAEKHPDGSYKAMIDECDEAGNYEQRRWVDFPFEKRNTGFEGLTTVRRRGENFLLALCEGNRCRPGRRGRKPGGGRIHVLRKQRSVWQPVARIKLPATVAFEDYSAVTLDGTRISVVSQLNSQLWIGQLRVADWSIVGTGRTYDFPRSRKGKIRYCTVEGISWLSHDTFVAVSDLSKRHYPKRCRRKDESIHIFRLPGRKRVR